MEGPFKINLADDWMYVLSVTFKTAISDFLTATRPITPTVQQLLLAASPFDTTKPHPQLPPLSPERALIGAVIFWPGDDNLYAKLLDGFAWIKT